MGHAPERDHGRPLPPPPPPLPPPPPPPRRRPRLPPIDREKTCPFLLRTFIKLGSHHSLEDFAVRGRVPEDEIQIYTWKDATLRELTDLVKSVVPAARRIDGRLSFALVFPDVCGIFRVHPVGKTLSYGLGRLDDHKMLLQLGFDIGDFIDVAIQ